MATKSLSSDYSKMTETNNDNEALLGRSHRSALILIGAEVCILFGAGVFSFNRLGLSSSSLSNEAAINLWVFVAFLAIGSIWLRRILGRPSQFTDLYLLGGVQKVVSRLFINTVIVTLPVVVIALVGVLLSEQSRTFSDTIRITILGGVVIIANAPRRGAWRSVVGACLAGKKS